MTNKEPFAVVKSGRGAGFLYVGGDPVLPGVEKGSDRVLTIVADKINAAHEAAVAPIQAKAELADRMVEKIRAALEVCEECGGGFFDSKPDQCPCRVIRETLAEYDRLNGKPEGTK